MSLETRRKKCHLKVNPKKNIYGQKDRISLSDGQENMEVKFSPVLKRKND